MEKQYNLQVLGSEMKFQYYHDLASTILGKCTRNCFISFKEADFLPTEEHCLRNCLVKSIEFSEYFEDEMKYTIRSKTSEIAK